MLTFCFWLINSFATDQGRLSFTIWEVGYLIGLAVSMPSALYQTRLNHCAAISVTNPVATILIVAIVTIVAIPPPSISLWPNLNSKLRLLRLGCCIGC